MKRWLLSVAGRAVLAAVAVVLAQVIVPALHAQETPARRVLLISTGSRLAPGFVMVDQQIMKTLGAAPMRIETYAENLDVTRFSPERSRRVFSEYLEAKYENNPPDVVVLVFVGNLGVTASTLEQLFPRTPIVVAGFTEEEFRPDEFGPLVAGFAQRVDARATLELMLRLQPGLRRVVAIGGTAEVDRQLLARVRTAARELDGRVAIEFWDNMVMADLREAVTRLPADTAVLYTRMFRDAAGQAFISSEVAQTISRVASVPTYMLVDTNLGGGAVGGSVSSAEAFGRRAGELVVRVLEGTPTASLKFQVSADTVPMFDWRALRRWGISEQRLPPGSDVRFRPPSLWANYRWHIAGVLLVIVLQGAMIAALIVERRHRQNMRATLEDNRQLMELAASAGELGLWSRRLDDNRVWANAAMRTLFGFRAHDDILMEDLIARVHPDDRQRMRSELERAQATELPFEGEFRTRLPDGTERWVMARGRTMSDGSGDDTRRMGVVLDVTERRKAEVALQEQRAELAHVARVSLMGELAASLAHELNQPLSAIRSNAAAAQRFLDQDPSDVGEVREILGDIVDDDDRAAEVIRQMRALVQKERKLELSALGLAEVIGEVVALARSSAARHDVRVTVEIGQGLPSVLGHRVQLQQVVLNLLLNAFDAMEQHPNGTREVAVRAQRYDGELVRVAVSDRGPGLGAELERIFEPFYTTKREGLGMGLSICRSIIQAHGGRLWAENNPQGGATFYFTVPTPQPAGTR